MLQGSERFFNSKFLSLKKTSRLAQKIKSTFFSNLANLSLGCVYDYEIANNDKVKHLQT
jgi:uncharacterized pyridoxal phosphate-containing UPF0001 family protein